MHNNKEIFSQNIFLTNKTLMIVVIHIAVGIFFEENVVFDWCPKRIFFLIIENKKISNESNKTKINLMLYSCKVGISGFLNLIGFEAATGMGLS